MALTLCNFLTNYWHNGNYEQVPSQSTAKTSLLTKLQHTQLLVNEQFAEIKNKIKKNYSSIGASSNYNSSNSNTMELTENIGKIQEAMSLLPQKDIDNLAWWEGFYKKIDTVFNLIHWSAAAVLTADTTKNCYYKWSGDKEPEIPWLSSMTTVAIATIAIGGSIKTLFNLQEKISKIKKTLSTIEKTQVMNDHFKEVIDSIVKLQQGQEDREAALNKALAALRAHEENEDREKKRLLQIAPIQAQQIDKQLKKDTIDQLGLTREDLLMVIIHQLPSTHPLCKALQDVAETAEASKLADDPNEHSGAAIAPQSLVSNQISRSFAFTKETKLLHPYQERLQRLQELAGFPLNTLSVNGVKLSLDWE